MKITWGRRTHTGMYSDSTCVNSKYETKRRYRIGGSRRCRGLLGGERQKLQSTEEDIRTFLGELNSK